MFAFYFMRVCFGKFGWRSILVFKYLAFTVFFLAFIFLMLYSLIRVSVLLLLLWFFLLSLTNIQHKKTHLRHNFSCFFLLLFDLFKLSLGEILLSSTLSSHFPNFLFLFFLFNMNIYFCVYNLFDEVIFSKLFPVRMKWKYIKEKFAGESCFLYLLLLYFFSWVFLSLLCMIPWFL